MNQSVSKLLAFLVLVGISTGCVVRSTPSRTVYRERTTTHVHDHRR